jgi:hypothetical protein
VQVNRRRTRNEDSEREGWTSGGDLADVEETPRSRDENASVTPQILAEINDRHPGSAKLRVHDGGSKFNPAFCCSIDITSPAHLPRGRIDRFSVIAHLPMP